MGDEGNSGFMAATAAGSDLHAATGCETALEILGELERRRPKKDVAAFLMAQISLELGDQEQAISWLQKAAD